MALKDISVEMIAFHYDINNLIFLTKAKAT